MSAQLLPLLGIKSFIGTLPADEITEKRGSLGVLISYEFWQDQFGGDPNVLGQKIFVDTWSSTIVAVLEPGFNLFGTGTPEVYENRRHGGRIGVGHQRHKMAARRGEVEAGRFRCAGSGSNGCDGPAPRAGFPTKIIRTLESSLSPCRNSCSAVGISMVDKTVSNSAAPWRFLSQGLELFAAIALMLAVIGIHGVISYSVGKRRQELGLRMALGSRPEQVLRLVLRQAMVLALISVVVGLAGSFVATPLLANFLYGVKAHDWVTLLLVSSLLMAVTIVASYIPARHATKIDPMRTLRHE